MKLPNIAEPQHYRGLYVYDFGEWTAVGYTAEEVAVLLESPEYRGGKVYKIVRAHPDGGMELRGVDPDRFQLESGMFFARDDREAAEEDFATLAALAADGVPCRAFLHLADRGAVEGVPRYVTALIYPAEYEDEIARWLLDADFAGGDIAEGGISHVTNYYAEQNRVLRREQLSRAGTLATRSPQEVLGNVRRAVQR